MRDGPTGCLTGLTIRYEFMRNCLFLPYICDLRPKQERPHGLTHRDIS